jgi:hypothetical protein
MTEDEWLTGVEPGELLGGVRYVASARKLRLVGCGCCDRVRPLLADERSRAAVEIARAFADGRASRDQLAAAHDAAAAAARALAARPGAWNRDERAAAAALAAKEVARPTRFPHKLATSVIDAGRAVLEAEFWSARAAARGREWQCRLVRCVFGNPFRPASLDPRSRTDDTLGLARGIYEEGAFDRLPLLADALMDAGCDSEDILAHCRGERPHVRGCWVVDLLLCKE